MKEALNCFHNDKTCTLELNGMSFSRSDVQTLGFGSDKRVYQIKAFNICFFLPAWDDEWSWNRLIQKEKSFLDSIIALGLKAQEFEIAPLTIRSTQGQSFTIDVLHTQDFKSLCSEQSLALYVPKALNDKVIGDSSLLYRHVTAHRFKEKEYTQKILQKILIEYGIGLTFSLPISGVKTLDDSEHYCFELPNDSDQPPVARYMFWDVTRDFHGVTLPKVPPLYQFRHTYSLASGLADAITVIACKEKILGRQLDSFETYSEIRQDIEKALEDNDLLEKAFNEVRTTALAYLQNILDQPEKRDEYSNNNESLTQFLKAAISTSNFQLVQNALACDSKPSILTWRNLNELATVAREYQQQPIIDLIEGLLSRFQNSAIKIQRFFKCHQLKKQDNLQEAISKNPYALLLSMIQLRFQCMRAVAAAKFPLKRAIEDKIQEASVINTVKNLAKDRGIVNIEVIERVFEHLITLSKAVQFPYHELIWKLTTLDERELVNNAYIQLCNLVSQARFTQINCSPKEGRDYQCMDVLILAREIIHHINQEIVSILYNIEKQEQDGAQPQELERVFNMMLTNHMTPTELKRNKITIELLAKELIALYSERLSQASHYHV